MNSMRFIQQAIDVEARRQIAILETGGKVEQETRLYDPDKSETRSMRSKEEAHDYRYFPDPDLLPLEIDQNWVDTVRSSLPELPDEKKLRFINDYKLTEYDAGVLTADIESADFFESVAKLCEGKLAANWVINELFGRLKKDDLPINESPVSPNQLAGIITLIQNEEISGKIAKELFEIVWEKGGNPKDIVKEKGLEQVSDDKEILKLVENVIADNQDKVKDYLSGKDKLFGFFVGQVMKISQGKANPGLVNKMLKENLK